MQQDIIFFIIVPIYNVRDFLAQCLDSIIMQDYRHFYAICINDGSTDDSLEIAQHFAQKDARFKVYSQANQGLSMARNKAFEVIKELMQKVHSNAGDFIESADSINIIASSAAHDSAKSCAPQTHSTHKQYYTLFVDSDDFLARNALSSIARDLSVHNHHLKQVRGGGAYTIAYCQ